MTAGRITVATTPRPGTRFYSKEDWMITSATPDMRLSGFFRNPKLKASYERAKQDAATGKIRRFSNVEDLIADLNTE